MFALLFLRLSYPFHTRFIASRLDIMSLAALIDSARYLPTYKKTRRSG
jgi:hypothetical protein